MNLTLTGYVENQVAGLIDSVAREAYRAEHDATDEGVHDLRVAIRRLSESLKVFSDLFPKRAAQSVRKDIKIAMRLAGKVRNHDIAVDLMKKAEVAVRPEIPEGRAEAAAALASVLAEWNRAVTFHDWKERLDV